MNLSSNTIRVTVIILLSALLLTSCSGRLNKNSELSVSGSKIVKQQTDGNMQQPSDKQQTGENGKQVTAPEIEQVNAAASNNFRDESPKPVVGKQVISPEEKQNSIKLYEQGNVLYNSGDYEGAVKLLKQAVQADPENYQAFNVLGVSQAFSGLYDEADKNIDQAIKINPGFAHAYFNKAISMKLQKKYDEAIKYFDETIRLNPNDVWSHYGKATIYSEREDVNNCIDSLKIALQRDPGVKQAVMDEPEFDPVRSNPEFKKLMQ